MRKAEERIQTAVCNYLKYQYPNVVFTSESSGIRVSMGVAIQMKKQRSLHKLPDLIILQPNKYHHGLVLELKKSKAELYKKNGEFKKSEHIEEQNKTLKLLANNGYKALFACGFDEAKDIIDDYMAEL